MLDPVFAELSAQQLWQTRYRLADQPGVEELGIRDSWRRVALALSKPESHHRDEWSGQFEAALSHFRFLPSGRILAGAGTPRRAALLSCLAIGDMRDSIDAIFSALGESAVTLQEGGGIGCDFSTLRPAGMPALSSGNVASGPVSFLQVWEQACATITSAGNRCGKIIACLRCDHPDIERFIDAKREAGALPHVNLSVLVSDDFMHAVEQDAEWRLVFPLADRTAPPDGVICERIWSGSKEAEPCLVVRTVAARALWERIQRAAFDCGAPGVIFIERVKRVDNLWYAERISACSPCGAVFLPPHGACSLGSINLTQFVRAPFGKHASMDLRGIADATAVATRMLDNVYEVSPYPLKIQARTAHASRRIGLGVTGLADAFVMLGLRYGSDASVELGEAIMRTVCYAAYRTSVALARERGPFPEYDATRYAAGDFISSLPREIVESIQQNGIRNSHLTAIAAAESISMLANNVSCGIEPVAAFQGERKFVADDGSVTTVPANDYAWVEFRKAHGPAVPLPNYFIPACDVDPLSQLRLQAGLQQHVDQAIAKNIHVPANASFDHYRDVYAHAYRLGLKGCSMSRAREQEETPSTAGCGW